VPTVECILIIEISQIVIFVQFLIPDCKFGESELESERMISWLLVLNFCSLKVKCIMEFEARILLHMIQLRTFSINCSQRTVVQA
jgi:hypothetical protein